MTTKDVTIKGGDELDMPRNPVAILEGATAAAKALKDVVSRKEKPVIMNGEQYLEYEDWQTVGQFYHYTAKTHDAVPVEINGVPGFKAYADLVDFRTGLIVGGAEAYCMRDESKWNTRTVYEWQGEGKDRHRVAVGEEAVPWYQLASMAQTRAGAKALRNRLAWVVVLAGYKPTPAEEVTGDDERKRDQPRTHFCTLHHCSFFKRGKMTSYAHPIKDAQGKDTGQWCYEPAEKPPFTTTEAPPTTPAASTAPEGSEIGEYAVKAPTAEAKAEPEKPARTINLKRSDMKNKTQFQRFCFSHFKLSNNVDICGELNLQSIMDITDYVDACQKIATVRGIKLEIEKV